MQGRNAERPGFDVYEDVECCSVIEGGRAFHEPCGEGDGIVISIFCHQSDPHILDEQRVDACTVG